MSQPGPTVRPPVLLVEDNPLNEMVAVGLLRLLGREVVVARQGQEALELLRTHPYAVVLMDVQMPVLDGLEATRRIRAELPTDHQPYVIALTANAILGDEPRCLEAGMDSYLAKPISKERLAAALTAADEQRRHVDTQRGTTR